MAEAEDPFRVDVDNFTDGRDVVDDWTLDVVSDDKSVPVVVPSAERFGLLPVFILNSS